MSGQPTARAGSYPMDSPSLAEPLRVELAPELLLPSQLPMGFRQDASLQPERRLMLAVLEEAVSDYQRHVTATDTAGKRVFRESHAWIASDDITWPCSFVNLCLALGFDPGSLRVGLRRWGDRQRERTRLGEPLVRIQLRHVAGLRSKATGRTARGRQRSRW